MDAEWAHLKDGPGTLTVAEIERVAACFEPPAHAPQPDAAALLAERRLESPAFNAWMRNNVAPHRAAGHAIVTLSTKLTGVPPGDVTDVQMDAVADWADAYGFGELRIGHEQNFILPDVPQRHLPALWERAVAQGLAAANVGQLTDIVCCPGGDYCSLANAKSIPIAEALQRRFEDREAVDDLGPIDLNISGCMNACGHHHVGHIGILGVDKKGAEFYQISLGGNAGQDASLGTILGPSFGRADVPEVIDGILEVYLRERAAAEPFLACVRRIGIEPFRQHVYANAG